MAGILCCNSVQTSLTRSKVRRSLLSLSLRSVNSDNQLPTEVQVVVHHASGAPLTLLEEAPGQRLQKAEAAGKQQSTLSSPWLISGSLCSYAEPSAYQTVEKAASKPM